MSSAIASSRSSDPSASATIKAASSAREATSKREALSIRGKGRQAVGVEDDSSHLPTESRHPENRTQCPLSRLSGRRNNRCSPSM